MDNNGNSGAAKFAAVMDARMKEHIPSDLKIDFAEITAGNGLKCNTFPEIIPAADYMVCRQLALGNTGDRLAEVKTTEDSGFAFVPEKMRKIKPGDHVVVTWVQDTAVVIDIVMRADGI
ncbi:hypothetical protein [Marvinbryantia formatexigens]|nr:hypothetical protein [Marvinbryantia formatexigens]UWO25230.1 hypothetical protein NQ534_01700 [Marvinbryantia formatexigens DSM 14469]SDH05165.1 hypothetical protein SAMN05660368_03758 [Marvinbryantia formatexigens]